MGRNVLILSLVFLVTLAVLLVGMYAWIQIATTVPPVPKPTITLGSLVTLNPGYTWQFRVVSASSGAPPMSFRLALSVGGYAGSSVPMPTYSGGSVNVYVPNYGYPFYVGWSDNDAGGTLTAGDTFTVSYSGYPNVTNGTAVSFTLLWSDSSPLASETWYA